MEKPTYYTYEEIRSFALQEDITDNKISIGMWAKYKGYQKIKTQENKKTVLKYFKPL